MHIISIPESARDRGRLMGLEKPIDPRSTAGVAIDFQRFFMDDGQPMGNIHALDITDNANRINAAIRAAEGTVFFTQHSMDPLRAYTGESNRTDPAPRKLLAKELRPGSDSYDLHPQLTRVSADICITKHQSSPLHPRAGTGLLESLAERGVKTIVITGLVTNGCCESTARDAYQHGFHVVFASDATAAMTDEEHNAALLSLSLYYAHVMTTDEIVKALEQPFSSDASE